ncbi:MAG TPA: HAD-IIA family hydrolase [Dermatophilaceae bacterium]|nr:HAD-IIA family hydrolase [Dermatophilaceae bacterium]
MICGFRGLVCDLDGVVYLGPAPVPHAVDALTLAIRLGVQPVFATNSAARTPAEVTAHLRRLGIAVDDHAVVTSAHAGAAHLAGVLPPDARVLAVGGPGVSWALAEAGLHPVDRFEAAAGPAVEAVLQGLGADVSWADLAEVALAVQCGALWVATNRDLTVPTDRGLCPGNGALIGAVAPAAGTPPIVTGKPELAMYHVCATRLGVALGDLLAVGDRLDTDIAGANRCGASSLHVLTGVTGVEDLVMAEGERRPRFLATDLRALHRPYLPASVPGSPGAAPEPVARGASLGGADGSAAVRASAQCGAARVSVLHDGDVRCTQTTAPSCRADQLDRADHRLRAIVGAAWAARDGGWVPSDAALARLAGWYDEAMRGQSR